MEVKNYLMDLSNAGGVSGHEQNAVTRTMELLQPYVDEVKVDRMGNLIALKRGEGTAGNPNRILFAAHVDEIGLMVTKIDDQGFLKFTGVGGFDPRTLYGQKVTVHGKKPLPGVIGPRPPHLLSAEENRKEILIEDMYIDVALLAPESRELVRVGDYITISRESRELADSKCIAGKAMDNRAGVAVLLCCAHELQYLKHQADIFLVATVQEEVGVRGVVTAAYSLAPDAGIAVDVCHGDMPSVSRQDTVELGKGPALALGPNIHPVLENRLRKLADRYNVPYQLDPFPGPTPTDARGIQVSREGIPAALLSIPLRYMHTSVEIIHAGDIEAAGRLLAYFVQDAGHKLSEDLRCI